MHERPMIMFVHWQFGWSIRTGSLQMNSSSSSLEVFVGYHESRQISGMVNFRTEDYLLEYKFTYGSGSCQIEDLRNRQAGLG